MNLSNLSVIEKFDLLQRNGYIMREKTQYRTYHYGVCPLSPSGSGFIPLRVNSFGDWELFSKDEILSKMDELFPEKTLIFLDLIKQERCQDSLGFELEEINPKSTFHITNDGTKLLVCEMTDNHLFNAYNLSIKRMQKNGFKTLNDWFQCRIQEAKNYHKENFDHRDPYTTFSTVEIKKVESQAKLFLSIRAELEARNIQFINF
jgi:hypothetical protein